MSAVPGEGARWALVQLGSARSTASITVLPGGSASSAAARRAPSPWQPHQSTRGWWTGSGSTPVRAAQPARARA